MRDKRRGHYSRIVDFFVKVTAKRALTRVYTLVTITAIGTDVPRVFDITYFCLNNFDDTTTLTETNDRTRLFIVIYLRTNEKEERIYIFNSH